MTDNELVTLADREAARLESENDHGAAIIMRALAKRVRDQRDTGLVEFDFISNQRFRHVKGMRVDAVSSTRIPSSEHGPSEPTCRLRGTELLGRIKSAQQRQG